METGKVGEIRKDALFSNTAETWFKNERIRKNSSIDNLISIRTAG